MNTRFPARPHASRGFTLLEALVTVVIVSIGLLGILGLQTVSIANTASSSARSDATIAADNLADRMRVNFTGARDGAYEDINNPSAGNTDGPDECTLQKPCNPAALADREDGVANRLHMVTHVENGSQAAKQGVKQGAVILEIAGHSTRGKDKDGVVTMIASANRPVAILSSDFSRTFETAKIVANAVGADVEAEPALRERDFGDFELGPNTAYEAVWEQDAIDATHTAWGVEAAAGVLSRAAGAVQRVEGAREGHAALLVSHGDCLQILQTAFAGVDVSAHRSLPHLETCELRRLELSGV